MPHCTIRQISSPEERIQYDRFVAAHPYTPFSQTSSWGAFQKHIPGRSKSWLYRLFDGEKMNGVMLVIRHDLPLGYCWLYTPRGPLLDWINQDVVDACAAHLAKLARQEKAIFWRIDPLIPTTDSLLKTVEKALQNLGARPAYASFQPEHTRMIDLTQTEEAILQQMKPKGRYNIRLAAKKCVTVAQSTDAALFTKMMQETARRDGFSAHIKHTYAALLETLHNEPTAKLFIASGPEGEPLAAAIVIFYGKTATYLYGASASQNRSFMAPYLLHWEIMRYAKTHGCTVYDFFGVAPEHAKNHPWRGVTEFKEKFGGFAKDYLPASEVVYKPFMYWLLKCAKAVRSL